MITVFLFFFFVFFFFSGTRELYRVSSYEFNSSQTLDMASLPGLPDEWNTLFKREGLERSGSSVHDFSFSSGSKFVLRDFLPLRILYGDTTAPERMKVQQAECLPDKLRHEVAEKISPHSHFRPLKKILEANNFKNWNATSTQRVPLFAVGLEHLHLIAKKGQAKSGHFYEQEKIFKTSATQPDSLSGPMGNLSMAVDESFGPEESAIADQSTLSVAPEPHGVDLKVQRTEERLKHAMFEKGDEQTVNACLVALIMPVAWMLGRHGIIHLDREPQRLLDKNGILLYEACVDGVITGSNGNTKSFMEVKADLRAYKKDVRMQIAAQMAAFIFQKSEKAEQERLEQHEQELEKAKKDKAKKAKLRKDMQKREKEEKGRTRCVHLTHLRSKTLICNVQEAMDDLPRRLRRLLHHCNLRWTLRGLPEGESARGL